MMAVRHMMQRFWTISIWLLGLLLVLIDFNLNDPYLIMMRGWGRIILLAASFAGLGLLLWRQSWAQRRLAGRLLVVLWCLPPLAMASAEATFRLRKAAVLGAQGPQVRELGQHFTVGY